jgi:MFS family permease
MSRLGGIGEAFADRNFRIYSVGSITSWITYYIQDIAFSWVTWEVTHSTVWLAVVAGITTIAAILFIPIGGVFADRYDRFNMMRIAFAFDLLKTIVLTLLAFMHMIDVRVICVAAFLHGVIHSFSIPAAYGMMPRFVSPARLASAIAVSSAYSQFAIFAGPALAGWILLHGGAAYAFLVNVIGYVIYFISTFFLTTPEGYKQSKVERKSLREDVLVGVTYIAGHKGLIALLMLVLVGDAIAMAVYKLMPAYSANVLLSGAGVLAALYGAAGIGATGAALWLAHGGARRISTTPVLWAVLSVAISVALLATGVSFTVSLAAMLFFGFAQETRRTGTVSMIQMSIDDAQRGRVLSSMFLFSQIAGGLGTMAVGLSAQDFGLRLPMFAAAGILAIAWLWTFRRRKAITHSFVDHGSSSVSQ